MNPDKPLTYLRLGDSESIQVGQKVLAIGNPFGLEGTLTTGIISSLGRTIRDENGQDLEDIPDEIRDSMNIHLVGEVTEAVSLALAA